MVYMKNQPNRNYKSNDVVMTPLYLCEQIVDYFKPTGTILEPCMGSGNFTQCFSMAEWCEIDMGRDFFDWHSHVDWIITNPPWSKIRDFLKHSYEVADNIVFLMTVNHMYTKARIRDMREAGFEIADILLLDMPNEFPQSGFQLGAVYLRRINAKTEV